MELNADLAYLDGVIAQPGDREEIWGVFNDPVFYNPRFESGELHPMLREKFEEPLYTNTIPGPAKRFMIWTNDQRSKTGHFVHEGFAILRKQVVVRQPWETITGQELEDIDDGRRANG